MIVVYHNPDSKKHLEVLETSKDKQQQIKYEEKPLDAEKLHKIINILQVKPIELIRTEDRVWRENFKHLIDSGHEFSDSDYVNIMIEYPGIIERPIVINGKKAVIGKPPKRILDIVS